MAKSAPKVANSVRSPNAAPVPTDGRKRVAIRSTFAILVFLLALWVTRDFLAPLAWAAVIAIALWPVYQRVAAYSPDESPPVLAPVAFTLAAFITIVLPFLLVMHQFASFGIAVNGWIMQLKEKGIPVPEWLSTIPAIGQLAVRWWESNLSDPLAARQALAGMDLETLSKSLLGVQISHTLLLFSMTLIALFFFLRDGAWIAGRVLDTADQLLGDPGERLASKMADAIRGVVNGTVIVALAEGAIIGAGYFIAGVPSPILFAVLTAAFAMVPFGAWFAFTAAAIVLFLHGGSVLAAVSIFGFGAVVMLVGDQFVWPALVGKSARLPFLLALIGILGGLQSFGLVGLFVGPVIMAAVLTIWREWLMMRRDPDAV
jgi:predicted PurR-regulated permease PerM